MMNWYFKFISAASEIHPYNSDTWDEDHDSDPYDVANEAEKSFSESGIRLDSTKNISSVVTLDGVVIGAIASSWHTRENVATFAFDMAIKPQYRGNVNLLFRMIKEGIAIFKQDASIYREMGDDVEMVLWVVNRKLIPVLERFGFEIDEDHGEGGAHMSYRGK